MYSISFPFAASSLPFTVQPREEVNCRRVLVNTAHWIWQCLHVGVSPWASAALVTSMNAVGPHLEGLTQHQWKTMKRLLFNAIHRLWVCCLTPAPAHPGVIKSFVPNLKSSRGTDRGFGRNCRRNTREENKCCETELQTFPNKHGQSHHFVHFYQQEVGPVVVLLTMSMNISKIEGQNLQGANRSPMHLHLPWKTLLGLLWGKHTSHQECQNMNPEWQKDQ